ncbi:7df857b8-d712-453e-b12d-f7c62f57da4a [Thermothielavioides terrestris]|nr:7df857b8-d712-453e-b12d-f7c62f57da4a [Thermothielavioides terrestris]
MPTLASSDSMHQPGAENSQPGTTGPARPPIQSSVSFHEGPTCSFPAQSPPDSTNSGPPTQVNTSQSPEESPAPSAGKCRYLGDACAFSTYSILLSPCIANFPWVTEDLLSCHGVTEFLRDPKEWLADQAATSTTTPASSSSGIPGASLSAPAGQKGRRKRKIVLVDARRREATVAFLQLVEAAQLKRRSGEREYVPVYDWRVLEAVREEEQKLARSRERPRSRLDIISSSGVGRRFWVGLA